MNSVDVIVPCYRYGHFLKECVASVLAQSGPCVRVLIIDDASPDNTPEVAAELARGDSRVMVIRHPENRGHIATYNEGIKWASADCLLLLSADDYLLPGALQRAVSLLNRHREVGFVFGNAIEIDERGAMQTTNAVPHQDDECVLTGQQFFRLSGARNIVPTPTAVIRTEVQKAVGGYRAELPHAGDMEMWMRLATRVSVGFIPSPQAVYRHHVSNMSLSYTAQYWLPDLEQRRSALDCVFKFSGHRLAEFSGLRRRMLYLLARDAVSEASKAFNHGELESCGTLAHFASCVSPEIENSLPWITLGVKRRLGLGVWKKLQPWVQLIHRA